MDNSINDPIDLCVPIYLNQQVVFDILAMLEDGFSQTNSENTSTTETKTDNSKAGISVGNLNLSYITLSLHGNKDKSTGLTSNTNSSSEKTHTPSSMFSTMRLKLYNEKIVHKVRNMDDITYLKCGDFVEFKSKLRSNPLIDNLSRFIELMRLADKFTNVNNKNQQNKLLTKEEREKKIVAERISEMLDELTKSNYTEIIGQISEDPRISVDISSKNNCFIDSDTSLVMNGEFYVFGKVTQVIHNKTDKINLLQKTPFRSLGEDVIKTFADAFNEVSDPSINIPEVTTKIEGPAIQVLPIAMFI